MENSSQPKARSSIGIWSRLNFSQKFAILAVFFALPVIIFIPVSLIEQYDHVNEYGIKEKAGTVYLRALWEVNISVQNYSSIYNQGASEESLEEARKKVDASLKNLVAAEEATESFELSFSANELTQIWGVVETQESIALFLEKLSDAILEVGNKSNLVLDPDLDTYYLMDAVLLKLPDNQNDVFRIGIILVNIKKNNTLSSEEQRELERLISSIRENLANLEKNLNTANEDNINQSITPELIANFTIYKNNLEALLSTLEQDVLKSNVAPNFEKVNILQASGSEANLNFYSLLSTRLESGIDNRINNTAVQVSSLLVLMVISTLGSFFVGNQLIRSISIPLQKTIQAAEAFSSGEFSTRIDYEASDEGGQVISAFNKLAQEVEFQQKNLHDRTTELENKTRKLETISTIAREVTTFRDISTLLTAATKLVHENFGYYHVGIFLLDERKEFAVLAAANSEGGKQMLEKGHQLKVGETGIVGYVSENLQARIALDVGADAVFFNNSYLPNTRSEMALPLVVSGQLLGVLDVQSTEPKAFVEDDINTLQILAEQIAVAIQNANLFSEAEKALSAARATYGQLSREAWSKMLRNQEKIGFLATPPATIPIQSDIAEPAISKAIETGDLILGGDGLTISVPVKIRGLVIGAIRLKKAEIADAWTQDETNLAISLSDQLSGALESARLYRESLQRAARESLVSDISARITSSATRDAIIRETVQELGQSIPRTSVTFQLLDQDNDQDQSQTTGKDAKVSINE